MHKNIIKFCENLLEERNYIIQEYSDCSFYANNNRDCHFKIHFYVNNNDEIVMHPDITYYMRDKTLKESIDELTTLYNNVQKDIDYVKKELLDLTQKDNIIKILEICEVPKEIIEYIKNKG